MSRKTIHYCGIPIEYSLTRKAVKNVNIRIHEDGEISVSASKGISLSEINDFVESKAEWIIRSLAALERYNQLKPDNEIYVGKRVFYLGEMYVIDIAEQQKEGVVLEEGIITLFAKETEDSEYLKGIYWLWLRKRATEIFKVALKKMYQLLDDETMPYPKMTIRNMKTRWGSCTPGKKNISLNLQLIKADMQCIEQVVLHELLHFKESGHNEQFYGLLNQYMPDWQERKERLEEKFKDGL